MNHLLLFVGILCSLPFSSYCSDLISVKVLSDRIIEVHFDDGYLIRHQIGESTSNDQIIAEELDLQAASILSNFLISSGSDPNFQTAQTPLAIYRKSKGTDFARLCEGWQFLPEFGVLGCDNVSPDHAKEHWIYLVLPTAMRDGDTYDLQINGQASGSLQRSFSNPSESSALHINNLGYVPDATGKYAYVYKWLGDGGFLDLSSYAGNNFELIDVATGNPVFTGSLTFRKDENTRETFRQDPSETFNENFLGAEVYECDFSAFTTPGTYYLDLKGIGYSDTFLISCDVLEPAFHLSMKGLFQNRSGLALSPPNTTSARPAPHNPQETPGFATKLKYTSTTWCEVSAEDADTLDRSLWEAGILGDLQSFGWYQDAGDWDAYMRHMEVPAKLMFMYEHFPQNFSDGQLDIPERANGIADILDEARWLLRFYKRLKDETEQNGWTTGGVPGSRIFGDLWGEDTAPGGLARYSYEDTTRLWIVSGEDEAMSYYYAGAVAQLAWIYSENGLADSEAINWTQEAIDVFAWAEQRYDANFSCHGYSLPRLRSYAAAALYRLTGSTTYKDIFEGLMTDFVPGPQNPLTGSDAYGAYIYALTPSLATSTNIEALVTQEIESQADVVLINDIDNRSCRWGGNIYFPMLVGHATTPYVFEGIMGYVWARNQGLAKQVDYLKHLHTSADYFLGTNPLNMSWITGLGDKSPREVYHLDARQNGNMEGYIPYGPWKREAFGSMGSWHHQWAEKTIYPSDPDIWPGHERWYSQTTSPKATEFTVNQNSVNAAALYGMLAGEANCLDVAQSVDRDSAVPTFSVFPNPATDRLEISSYKGSLGMISCYDLQGRLHFQVSSPYTKQELSIDFLPAGIYVLEIGGRAIRFVKN